MEYQRVALSQPRYGTVNAYRVGDTLVDTGHVSQASRDRLRGALSGGALDGVERVVLTHPHVDHAGGSLTEEAVTRLPHVVFRGADDVIRRYDDYLREAREEMAAFASAVSDGRPEIDERYFPTDLEYATDAIELERVVDPGDTVEVGPYDCEVVHTPGHAHHHVALHHEPSGVVLSGDIVSTNGHFMYGPVHWDVGEYKTGLQRLADCEPECLLPGHGDPMTDPMARIEDALEKAERAEASVLEAVRQHGSLDARELAVEALGATGETVGFLATVASVYAVYLAEQGLIEVERRPYVVAHSV